ncbi:MAG: ROK family transcriptional regulator [Rhizobiaceae bacterium]|nr:ROK family transcriptional regulator [Rhizobiaceae bacterium]
MMEPFDGLAQPTQLRGTNQSGMRAFNERLVLTVVYRNPGLAQRDIARATGLSAQTVSVIIRQLERDGLLLKGEPVRGRVGQPSVPLAINPRGAFFLGLKVGRRSAEIVLTDFLGTVLATRRRSYRWPTPDRVVDFARDGIASLTAALPEGEQRRLSGIGIATPFELWNWAAQTGAPSAEMEQWRGADLQGDIAAITDLPVFLINDATAACAAELRFGRGAGRRDFIHFYIGTFIGGGVVLNGGLYNGRTGYAGSIGGMPVADEDGKLVQIIDLTSIIVLERMVEGAGLDASPLWNSPDNWPDFGPHTEQWVEIVARGLAQAVIAAASIIDFEFAIIDGGLPESIRTRIVEATRRAVTTFDLQGVQLPAIEEGSIGINARALGAASLPLVERFLLDRDVALEPS